MNKLAIFVEGYTEVVFVSRLIEEIAGEHNVLIESRQIRGGSSARRTMSLLQGARPATGQRYFVLLVDCGGDDLVKDRIREEHENLSQSGYSRIIGLRDVRPRFTHAEIARLEAGLPKYIKTSLIPVEFILAVMEIEAWFLAEASHFPKIHPAITPEAIRTALGFDPASDDLAQRLAPADDLNRCYALGGKAYVKHRAQDTVDALDYARIYVELVKRFGHLERLIGSIEKFLS